jgi:N-acetylglucosamine-6-phosphate deacetylase
MAVVVAAGGVCGPGRDTTKLLAPGWLAIDGGRVVEVGPGRAPATPDLDLGDALLAPGFVDLQVNGVDDVDFATADDAGWTKARRHLLACGVTACCPTLISAPVGAYDTPLERAAAARHDREPVTTIVGVHLEGPFLGDAPGAHAIEHLRPADRRWLSTLLDAHSGLVRIVTLAPEADPGLAATRMLTGRGVIVALGHSTATYAEALAAADAGAVLVTHLFNGMGPWHHREPGLIGAALDDDRLTPTLIADLVHVHPAALRLAIAQKPNVALVSDAVAFAAGEAENAFAGPDGAPRLADGTLVGSVVTLDRALANVVGLGVPVARAVEMAAAVPARVLGLDTFGALGPGGRADLVALDPVSLRVRAVWLGGERAPLG